MRPLCWIDIMHLRNWRLRFWFSTGEEEGAVLLKAKQEPFTPHARVGRPRQSKLTVPQIDQTDAVEGEEVVEEKGCALCTFGPTDFAVRSSYAPECSRWGLQKLVQK